MSTSFTVSFANQPATPPQAALIPVIGQTIVAAGMWLNSFVKGWGTIDVRVNFDSLIASMSGASLASEVISTSTLIAGKTYTVVRGGVAAEWQSGKDINGASSDAVINIGTTNLERWYAFDATLASSNDIPANKTDAFRVLMHELIHGMGMNGFLCNGSTGATASLYDQYFATVGGRSYFTGTNAQMAFGGPVPVTNSHLGDTVSFANNLLTGSQTVMSYDNVPNGQRISLDPVLIGVLRDLGYTVRDTQASFVGMATGVNTAQVGLSASGVQWVKTLDLAWLTFQNRSEYSYLLQNVQRLEFTDKKLAIDLKPTESAGQAVDFIGMLAPDFIKNPGLMGQLLDLFDKGFQMSTVCQKALDLGLVQSLAGSNSHESLVSLLFKNVVGVAPTAAQVLGLTAYMDGRTAQFSQADFMAAVANSELNQTRIGLVGLQQTGIEYLG